MPRYRVTMQAVASVTVEVEADDEAQATDKAYDIVPYDVCAQCSGWGQPWSMDLGEFEVVEDDEYSKGVKELDRGDANG